jgi:NADPH:quinone reductase-like Zn-dependent oxidoreductase
MEVLGATKFGDYNQVLEFQSIPQLPKDELGPKDVLIQVSYTDLNPVDFQKLKGGGRQIDGSPVPDPPFVPGYGGSGIVQEVGSQGPQHLMGKNVCFLVDPTRRGSYASHVVVDSRCVAAIPASVELRDAASIPVAGLTAYECLVKIGLAANKQEIKQGSLQSVGLESSRQKETTEKDVSASLLIVGGSGGVGSWIITLARAWHPNLKIIVTASPESHAWCTSLGASQVIAHNRIADTLAGGPAGSVSSIICLTEPKQLLFNTLAEVIQPYGQICLVVAGKGIESLNMGFCFFKCANVLTCTVFSSIRTKYNHIVPAEELHVILGLLASQTIQAPLSLDLEGTSEKFQNALKDGGVLKLLAAPHRRGNLVMMIHSDDDLVFLDLKTASILKIPRKECMDRKILTKVHSKDDGRDFWQEEAQSPMDREDRIKLIVTHKTLGIVKVAEKQWNDYQDGIDMQEAENVKNLWGVQLKKREKNIKGEELLFVDPRLQVIGEFSRNNFIKKGGMTVIKDDEGDETIEEAITNVTERDEVVQIVRQALKLSLDVA